MARIRSIKPDLPHSESMGRVSRDARLLFILLWTLADDSGTLRGSSRMLASLLFPYDDDAPELIASWLGELLREECIAIYESEGSTYVYVRNWLRHQKIDRPTASKLPQWDGNSRGIESLRESSPRKGREGIGEEGSGKEEDSSEPPLATAEPTLLSFPVVGDKKVREWHLTASKLAEYRESFPGVDPLTECRKARQWCVDNPTKRKTLVGMPAFLSRWLTKAQDSAGGRGAGASVTDQTKSAVEEFLSRRETEHDFGGMTYGE